jgi:hypothetical protein
MGNFWRPAESPFRLNGGCCVAFDREEARGCEFWEEGRDGFCAHQYQKDRKGKLELVGGCYRIGKE